MQQDQTVSEMAEEVLMRQTKALAHGSGHSLKMPRQAISDTEAGRQLRDLATVSIATRRPSLAGECVLG